MEPTVTVSVLVLFAPQLLVQHVRLVAASPVPDMVVRRWRKGIRRVGRRWQSIGDGRLDFGGRGGMGVELLWSSREKRVVVERRFEPLRRVRWRRYGSVSRFLWYMMRLRQRSGEGVARIHGARDREHCRARVVVIVMCSVLQGRMQSARETLERRGWIAVSDIAIWGPSRAGETGTTGGQAAMMKRGDEKEEVERWRVERAERRVESGEKTRIARDRERESFGLREGPESGTLKAIGVRDLPACTR